MAKLATLCLPLCWEHTLLAGLDCDILDLLLDFEGACISGTIKVIDPALPGVSPFLELIDCLFSALFLSTADCLEVAFTDELLRWSEDLLCRLALRSALPVSSSSWESTREPSSEVKFESEPKLQSSEFESIKNEVLKVQRTN